MRNEYISVHQVAATDTTYNLLVEGIKGEDRLVKNVFVKNDSSGGVVTTIARVPRGETPGAEHECIVNASLAANGAIRVETDIALPGSNENQLFDLYVKGNDELIFTADVRTVGAGEGLYNCG